MVYKNTVMNIESQFCEPWRICGRYKDGFSVTVGGNDEPECMAKLIGLADKHGDLVWYSGYEDLDYCGGEYIGRENVIF